MRWFHFLSLSLALLTLPAMAGNAAPDFTLRNLTNEAVTLSGFKGKVVVLSFWATWCNPCQAEMPHLEKMYEDLKDQGLVVVGISADDAKSSSMIRPIVAGKKLTYPVLLDPQTQVVNLYNPNKTLPFTVLIDRAGNLVESHAGYNAGDEVGLREKVVALLGQTSP